MNGGYEKKESKKADYTSAFGIGTKDWTFQNYRRYV